MFFQLLLLIIYIYGYIFHIVIEFILQNHPVNFYNFRINLSIDYCQKNKDKSICQFHPKFVYSIPLGIEKK